MTLTDDELTILAHMERSQKLLDDALVDAQRASKRLRWAWYTGAFCAGLNVGALIATLVVHA